MRIFLALLFISSPCFGKTQKLNPTEELYEEKAYQEYLETSFYNLAKKKSSLSQEARETLDQRCFDLIKKSLVFPSPQLQTRIRSQKKFKKCGLAVRAWNYVITSRVAPMGFIARLGELPAFQKALIAPYLNRSSQQTRQVLSRFKNLHQEKGRYLYSKGKYQKAATQYEKIDEDYPGFISSREELAWSYLMAGLDDRLRGLVIHLNSEVTPFEWRLESRALNSILLLKSCHYDQVNKELDSFQKEMDMALDKYDRGEALRPHFKYQVLARSLDQLYFEQNRISEFVSFSRFKKGKPLKAFYKKMVQKVRRMKKQEGRLARKNFYKNANEALVKMKFVRAELMNRLHYLDKGSKGYELVNSPHMTKHQKTSKDRLFAMNDGDQIYPAGKDLWVDETYKLRGQGASACELYRGVTQ